MERGRSLSELGRRLRWTDVRAFMMCLPSTSYFREQQNPKAALHARWSTPEVQLLGLLVDAAELSRLGGQDVQEYQGIIARTLDPRRVVKPVKKKKELTAAEIRRRVLG